jgi:two-component system, NarL family, response regulator NreC
MAAHLHLAPAPTEPVPDASSPSPIRVVLADDHALIRRSLRLALEGEEGVEVIGEADDLTSAIREVEGHKPDVLVLDLRMSDGSSVETVANVRERAPDTQVVVLTMHDDPVFAQHALASGALGFVMKELADHELPQAIRAAVRGDEYVSPRVSSRLQGLRSSLIDDVPTRATRSRFCG